MAGGRPLKFKCPILLQKKIDDYFDEVKKNNDVITITGLALHLDTCRSTLCEYDKRDEFSNTIKRAKQRVEADYEKSLRNNGRAGDIFGLKNFGWSDKKEVDMNANLSISDALAALPSIEEAADDEDEGDEGDD